MKSPLFAAAMAVAFFLAAPMIGRSLARTIDASDIIEPLACAMAQHGACMATVTVPPSETSVG